MRNTKTRDSIAKASGTYSDTAMKTNTRHNPLALAVTCTCTLLMAAGVAQATTARNSTAASNAVSEPAPDTNIRLAQATTKFSLPSQPLADSLRAIAAVTNSNILFDRSLVSGITARPLNAELTVKEAIAELLKGTQLTFRNADDKTVLITSKGQESAGVGAASAALEKTALRLARNDSSSSNQGASAESDQNASENTGQKSQSAGLQEIVVTATKRAERIQDVPMSITAITAEDIDRRGLIGAEDYLRGIPGVNQVSDAVGQAIVIRGIETTPTNHNSAAGTTVATYFGETPTTNTAGLAGGSNVDLKLVDIERVEVLRGPQGTAFGNSSLGGAVRTIPVAPKLDRFEGKAAVGYSATSGAGGDNHMVQAIGNIPLVRDKLAIRAVAYQFEDSGFYRGVAGSDPATQALATLYGIPTFATDKDEIGATRFTGGRVAALFQASEALKFTLSYLTQKTEHDGQWAESKLEGSSTGAYEQALLQVAPQHVSRGQRLGVEDKAIDLANATAEYDLGWASLLATYSYIKSGSTWIIPHGNLPASNGGGGPDDHHERSGEIRMATKLQGAWNFLGGLYAEDVDDDSTYTYYQYGVIGPRVFGVPGEFMGGTRDQRNLRQKAAFLEASWTFLERFTLTGGVRAYEYERLTRLASNAFAPTAPATPSNMDTDQSGTSFRGNLSYKPNDDALLYAGWAQGFRLGKAQTGLAPGACDVNGDGIVDGTSNTTIESTKIVNSDEVDSYELGGKFALFDNRLAIAADVYRIDWRGVPFRVFAPPQSEGGCGFGFISNGGVARSEGVDLQATLYLTRALRVDVGGSLIRAELVEDAPGLIPPGFDGDRLPGSPKVNGNLSFAYEFDIAGRETSVRADTIYIGSFFGRHDELASTEAGGYVKVDASARMTFGNLDVDLFVRNLTNENTYTSRGTSEAFAPLANYRMRPRTVGLQLQYNFN